MPICKLCSNKFPSVKKIDGKKRNLGGRKYCLECSPFGFHNTRRLDNKLIKKANKLSCQSVNDGKKVICKCCARNYIYYRNKGHTLELCNSCVVYISRGKIKDKAVKYKGGECEKCGYNKCIASLCFHHIDPNKKDFSISHGHHFGWETIKKELEKCILLCINCHNETHYTSTKHYDFITNKVNGATQPKKCNKCSGPISRGANICLKCYVQPTKIQWPSTDKLIKMIKKSSYTGVAKKLGVSDNAIRKRIKNH